uniref:Serpentine receptor class gamma n=1 Tax=Parastrongyloides trichosuri TaxID=131310 RepID=A0A0N5A6C6_PARTI
MENFFILYILICIYLVYEVKNPNAHFHSSFVIHFTFNAFFDLLSTVCVLVFRRLPQWELATEYFLTHQSAAKAYKVLFFQSMAITICGNIIMASNRFFALYNPLNYKRIWNVKISFIIIIFQVLICYASYIHILCAKTVFKYDNQSQSYNFSTPDKTLSLTNNGVLLFFCIFGIIMLSVMNFLISLKFKHIFNKDDHNKYGSQITMLIFMCLTTLFLIITSVQLVVRSIAIDTNNTFMKYTMNNYFFYSIPILNTLQPYLILILSHQLRKDVLKFLCSIPHKKICTSNGDKVKAISLNDHNNNVMRK